MIGAGRRDSKIAFERKSVTYDDHGGEVPTWAIWCMEWAAVHYGRGDEQRRAAQEAGVQPATFEVLAHGKTRALTVTDRIRFDAAIWDIVAVNEMPGRAMIRVTAKRAA